MAAARRARRCEKTLDGEKRWRVRTVEHPERRGARRHRPHARGGDSIRQRRAARQAPAVRHRCLRRGSRRQRRWPTSSAVCSCRSAPTASPIRMSACPVRSRSAAVPSRGLITDIVTELMRNGVKLFIMVNWHEAHQPSLNATCMESAVQARRQVCRRACPFRRPAHLRAGWWPPHACRQHRDPRGDGARSEPLSPGTDHAAAAHRKGRGARRHAPFARNLRLRDQYSRSVAGWLVRRSDLGHDSNAPTRSPRRSRARSRGASKRCGRRSASTGPIQLRAKSHEEARRRGCGDGIDDP